MKYLLPAILLSPATAMAHEDGLLTHLHPHGSEALLLLAFLAVLGLAIWHRFGR